MRRLKENTNWSHIHNYSCVLVASATQKNMLHVNKYSCFCSSPTKRQCELPNVFPSLALFFREQAAAQKNH